MNQSRIDKLRAFLAQDPADPFTRYAIALEFDAGGDTAGAIGQLQELLHGTPAYVPTYQLLGTLLTKMDRREEARAVLQEGIRTAAKANDGHARSEMQDALDQLED